MAIDHDKLLSAIEAKAENAYGSDNNSAIAEHRAALIEAYLGFNTNPAPEGRSQIVDRAVFETIQTTLPALVRVFSSGDEVVKFTPTGPEDEPMAEQATAVVNWIATQQNPWEQFVADWIHDALLLPNGYAMAYLDDSEHVERETYEGQTDEQLAVLVQDDDVTVIQHSQEPDEEQDKANAQAFQQAMQQYQQAAMQAEQQFQQTGQPPQLPPPPEPPQPTFLHDVVLERKCDEGKIKICVLPPEHCYVAEDTPDWSLLQAPYFEVRQSKTIGDLRAMGLDVPDNITDYEGAGDEPEDWARNRFGEDSTLSETDGDLSRKVVTRMVWVKAAAEDDEERMYYAILVGKSILWAEAVSRIPVVSLVTQPLPHRHPGMPLSEMVVDVQHVKTAIKRGALDNLYLANNGRFAISDKVNLDDFLDSRPGGVVRLVDGALPGEGHVFPLTHPFAFDNIVGSLEYFDQDRQNQGGVNRYFSGTDAGAINKTASGTMALQNMSAQRVEHIARTMAAAFEHLFSIIQELCAKHQNKAEVIKLRGEWVNVDPTAWKTRRDAKISVGVGAGNKDSMLMNLNNTFQKQMALLPLGMANPESIHATLVEELKLQGFSNPLKHWPDPKQNPPPPQQPPPEIVKAQMELQADQQKFQAQAQLDQQKMAQEAQNAERDAQLKMATEQQKIQLQAELEKYKVDLQAQTALQIEQMRLGGQVQIKSAELEQQRELAQFSAQSTDALEEKKIRLTKKPDEQLTDQLTGVLQGLTESVEKLNKPKVIVRDPKTNRVVGIQGAE